MTAKEIWILEIGEPLPLEKDVRLHRYGEFTRYLARDDINVTWWTSSFSHAPKKHLVEKDCEILHGQARMKIIRGPGYPRNVSLERIRHNAHFAQRFLELAPGEKKPDLIICPIPTINIAAAAVQFAKSHDIPILLDIRDMWPDELVDILPRPLRFIGRILLHKSFKNMKFVCRNVDGIMGVSNDFIDYGLQFSGRQKNSKDFLFPLGYSAKKQPDSELSDAKQWFLDNFGSSAPFTLCFMGTIGRFFDLNTVIQAAKELPDIRFILAGDGSHRHGFIKSSSHLPNVHFPGWLKSPQIQVLMSHSQAGLAPYSKDAKMTLPNKPFEYMSGSLPIISSLTGDLEQILHENQAGISYTADSKEELKSAIIQLSENPELCQAMSKNSRRLLDQNFSTEIIFKQTREFLESFLKD